MIYLSWLDIFRFLSNQDRAFSARRELTTETVVFFPPPRENHIIVRRTPVRVNTRNAANSRDKHTRARRPLIDCISTTVNNYAAREAIWSEIMNLLGPLGAAEALSKQLDPKCTGLGTGVGFFSLPRARTWLALSISAIMNIKPRHNPVRFSAGRCGSECTDPDSGHVYPGDMVWTSSKTCKLYGCKKNSTSGEYELTIEG